VLDDQERELSDWQFAKVGASSYKDVFVEGAQFLLIKVDTRDGDYLCQYELKVH
jgi:hypothetical protein